VNRNPSARDLLGAVSAWLGKDAPASRFDRAVAANALGMVERELLLRAEADAAASARIAALLGNGADQDALVQAIRSGALPPDDPALLEHLRLTALDALAIDQPRYVHALAEPFTDA